jgi:hypothetical protein
MALGIGAFSGGKEADDLVSSVCDSFNERTQPQGKDGRENDNASAGSLTCRVLVEPVPLRGEKCVSAKLDPLCLIQMDAQTAQRAGRHEEKKPDNEPGIHAISIHWDATANVLNLCGI